MSETTLPTIRKLAVIAGLAVLVACKPPPPPPVAAPPPPPPPKPVQIPMRPLAPGGASTAMLIPQLGPDGVRETVNARLSPLEAVWNFRAGWNVAALNCLSPKHAQILDGYKAFLENHSKRLTAVNAALDREYRSEHRTSRAATIARESYMTQVYNYFALPPAHDYFCDEALKISQEMLLTPPTDTDAFALNGLPRLEAAFEAFFQDFENYHVAVADWDSRYGARYGASQTRGAVFTNATYGPPESQSEDVTVPAQVAEDYTLPEAEPVEQPAGTTQPIVQPTP